MPELSRMKRWFLLDFETASRCKLKKTGAWRYSEDPTTEVLCLGWSDHGGKPKSWVPGEDDTEVIAAARDPEVVFIAFNVTFEKAIWRNIMVPVFDWPDVPDERWHDIQAVCAMKVIPLDLDRAARIMRVAHSKDKEGSKFTIGLSKPNKKTGQLDRKPESIKRVRDYCEDDIYAEVDLHRAVGWQTPEERQVWLLDQTINQRGVRLDTDYIAAANKIVREGSLPLLKEFRELTGGLEPTQVAKVLAWCRDAGADIPNFQKETLAELLGGETETDEPIEELLGLTLPPAVRRILEIRQLIGSASVKKLIAMENCVCADGAARGLLQYHGAGPGRWAGRLLQPQNFPRGELKLPIDVLVAAIMTGDYEYVETITGVGAVQAVVSGLRHAIIAREGRMLTAGDFNTIELRVNLAFAEQWDKITMLANKGDPYIDMAKLIFANPNLNKKDNPEERQTGKNSVLGLGFQMGAPKFQLKYAKDKDLDWCKNIVRIFREEWAPNVPSNWYELEEAACRTAWDRTAHEAKGVLYQIEDGWMTARLPSGRKLYYCNPQPCKKAMPWDALDIRPAWTYRAMKMGQWRTIDAYGGLLTENVVQGTARDLMVHAMFSCEREGFPVILTVHDEIVTEPEKGDHKKAAVALEQIMCDIPAWARAMQIPVAAEAWSGERYKK